MNTPFTKKFLFLLGSIVMLFIIITIALFLTHRTALQTPHPHILFVDQNTQKRTHTGSSTYPFPTIVAALEQRKASASATPTTIIIAEGTYDKHIVLPRDTTLLGSGTVTLRGQGSTKAPVVRMETNTALVNLQIIDAPQDGIAIAGGATARLSKVSVDGSDHYGVFMESLYDESTPAPDFLNLSEEEIASLPHVRISNSTIRSSARQGLYLQDGRVTITDSLVEDNGEEGIDLHPNMHATVTRTTAQRNGESGLESEIGNNVVIVEDSIFVENQRSGVSFSTTKNLGKIRLRRNTITSNAKFGLQCVRHADEPAEPRPFFPTVILDSKNTFSNNGENANRDCSTF